MVKWLKTYCFLKQFCGTKKCFEHQQQKCCGNCENFSTSLYGDQEEYKCKIHEFPDDSEVFPCGCFCKDYTPKSEN